MKRHSHWRAPIAILGMTLCLAATAQAQSGYLRVPESTGDAKPAAAKAKKAAISETVVIRPSWKAGDEVRYRIVTSRETVRSDQATKSDTMESALSIRVIEAAASGYRLGWRLSLDVGQMLPSDAAATTAKLKALLPKTFDVLEHGPDLVILADEDGLPTQLENPDSLKGLADALSAEFEQLAKHEWKDAADKQAMEAMTPVLQSLLDFAPEAMAHSQLAFAQSLLGVMGGEFHGSKPIDSPVMLENPIGQMLGADAPGLPARQRWQLRRANPLRAEVEFRIDMDPDGARGAIVRTMEKLGEMVGRPVPKDAYRRVAIAEAANYTIDRISGWPERVTTERRIEIDASNGTGARTESRTFERLR